jgi:hypothetical protein
VNTDTATAHRPRRWRDNVLVATGAAVALALVLTGTSFAGKSSTTPWIGLATVAGQSAPSVQPMLGDYVTFNTVVPSTVKNPRIEVDCYQNGQMTFGMGGATDYAFQLGGAGSVWLWNGGAADCTASLFYFGSHAGKQTFNVLATTSFSAGG